MNRLFPFGKPSRAAAILEGGLVTLIWASSFVLVKMGLVYVGPLTLAGMRYFLACLLVLPFVLRRGKSARSWSPRLWLRLGLIGFCAYTLGNGALFWGLKYLPATTAAFLLNLVPLLILFLGIAWLHELPTRWQIIGVIVGLTGSLIFFSSGLKGGEPLGIAIVLVGLVGFAAFGILGRGVARDQEVGTLPLTAIPLAFGGGLLLLIALILEGWPQLPLQAWGIVLVLALMNTALAYMLYNHALQSLTALEMSMVLNLAPLVTAVLALIFLNETISGIQLLGMVVVIAGVALVQWGGRRILPTEEKTHEPNNHDRTKQDGSNY